jgi:hypothetical protein
MTQADWVEMIVTVVCAVLVSSGFWAYITKNSEKKDLRNQLLMGLAHDRIVYLGMTYIDRDWITQDEYENLHEYLYKPYLSMGGNGSAKRIMDALEKLPVRKTRYSEQNTKEREKIRNENDSKQQDV